MSWNSDAGTVSAITTGDHHYYEVRPDATDRDKYEIRKRRAITQEKRGLTRDAALAEAGSQVGAGADWTKDGNAVAGPGGGWTVVVTLDYAVSGWVTGVGTYS